MLCYTKSLPSFIQSWCKCNGTFAKMGKVLTSYTMYVKTENFYLMPPLNNRGKDVGTVTYCTSTGIMKHAHRMQKKKRKRNIKRLRH